MRDKGIRDDEVISSLMSGNKEKWEEMVSKIESKVDKKVSDGEINRKELEGQAKNVLNKGNCKS